MIPNFTNYSTLAHLEMARLILNYIILAPCQVRGKLRRESRTNRKNWIPAFARETDYKPLKRMFLSKSQILQRIMLLIHSHIRVIRYHSFLSCIR